LRKREKLRPSSLATGWDGQPTQPEDITSHGSTETFPSPLVAMSTVKIATLNINNITGHMRVIMLVLTIQNHDFDIIFLARTNYYVGFECL
jgi:hypothetical protein